MIINKKKDVQNSYWFTIKYLSIYIKQHKFYKYMHEIVEFIKDYWIKLVE